MAHMATYLGCIYLAEVSEDGTLESNWESPGEAYPLSLQLSDEVVSIKSRRCDTGGMNIGSKKQPAGGTGSLTLHEYTANSVAKGLKAMVTKREVSASTLTDQAVTVGKFGEFVEIGAEDLSSVVVTDSTGSTTYEEGVDYDLNPVLGLIAAKKGGGITEDGSVLVDAESGAFSGARLTIGAKASGKYALKGNLVNEFSGESVKIYLRKVTLTTNNEVNFISEEGTEHEQIEFTLTPEIPTGQKDYGTIDGLPL